MHAHPNDTEKKIPELIPVHEINHKKEESVIHSLLEEDNLSNEHNIIQNTKIVNNFRKKINNSVILHFKSSKYFSKMHRILHISHLLLNLLLGTLMSSKIETSSIYILWFSIFLQSTNTFITQMEAFFGFHKRAGLHENSYKLYKSLLTKTLIFSRNGISNKQYEDIVTEFNDIEQNSPSYPNSVISNINKLYKVNDIEDFALNDTSIPTTDTSNIPGPEMKYEKYESQECDDGGYDTLSIQSYLKECVHDYFGLK